MCSLSRIRWVLASIVSFMVAAFTISVTHAEQSLYAPATCCDMARSGDYGCPAPWAISTDLHRNAGYYVGGGDCCPYYGYSERCRNEGTWGWDYVGYCVKPLVRLGWWNPPHYQGGPGAYAPDGPHFCEDLKSR